MEKFLYILCNINSIRSKTQIGRISTDVHNIVYRRSLDARNDNVQSGRIGLDQYRTGIVKNRKEIRARKLLLLCGFRASIWWVPF